jgi:hypothetical protein
MVGVLLGGVNGIGFFFITERFYESLKISSYKTMMLLGAITLTAVSGFVLFASLFSIYAVRQDTENRIFPIALATVLAVISSGYLSQSIVRWHKKLIESKGVASSN